MEVAAVPTYQCKDFTAGRRDFDQRHWQRYTADRSRSRSRSRERDNERREDEDHAGDDGGDPPDEEGDQPIPEQAEEQEEEEEAEDDPVLGLCQFCDRVVNRTMPYCPICALLLPSPVTGHTLLSDSDDDAGGGWAWIKVYCHHITGPEAHRRLVVYDRLTPTWLTMRLFRKYVRRHIEH